jgi:cysteine desulfurase
MPSIYLDYAAATPIAPEVLDAMQPYLTERFYNPSASYMAARQVANDLEAARVRVAHHLGARPSEVIFTAGGTEANNLAIHGVMSQFPDANLVVSSVEHEALLAPARLYSYKEAKVKPNGVIDLYDLEQKINDKTVLVSIMYANNEIGAIQPIRRVSQLIEKVRKSRKSNGNQQPIYLHADACQAAAYLDLHASRLGVDLMTINAGKIYGPKQTGALFISTAISLTPQIVGGGQESGLRSGTENLANIVGFAAALDLVQARRHEEVRRLSELQKLFFDLVEEKLPTAIVNGSRKHRLPNNIHLTLPGQDNERLLFALDEKGIICAVGSACSASNQEPSHVLRAIGLSDAEAQSSLRFTLGIDTDEAKLRHTVDELAALVA